MTGWQDTAPCKGLSKLFFPAHNERPEAGVIREAKSARHLRPLPPP